MMTRMRQEEMLHTEQQPRFVKAAKVQWESRILDIARRIQMKWITREKVKVDRVACPWLIKKFVDQQAQFLLCLPTR
jgi:hypothetical protein